LTITATNTNATTVGNATAGQAVLPGTTVTGIPTQPAANPTNMQTTVSPVNGTLIVSSKPVGASVYLDSAMVGKTPLTLDSVSPGAHTVELKSPGYLSVSIDVVVSADKPTEISPEMVNAPSGIPLSPFVAIFGFIGAMALFATIRKRIP
jgi:hypothetical protein